jgi:hypothetical protein
MADQSEPSRQHEWSPGADPALVRAPPEPEPLPNH